MLMSERPLAIDVSSHNAFIDRQKAYNSGNNIMAVIMRAGKGLIVDESFEAFDNFYNWDEVWRGSYWALWPAYSAHQQVDLWLETDPDGTFYMLDYEVAIKGDPLGTYIAFKMMSDMMLARTGKRPIIYGAYYFLMDNLIPFANEKFLNEHYYVLAQYDKGDGNEYESINLPNGIDIDRVIFKQTTSKLELYPGSGNIDRDRFLLGDEDDLNDWFAIYTGSDIEPDPVDPTEPSDLEQRVTVLEEALALVIHRFNTHQAGCISEFQDIWTREKELTTMIRELQILTGELRIGFRTHSSRQKLTLAKMARDIKAIKENLNMDDSRWWEFWKWRR